MAEGKRPPGQPLTDRKADAAAARALAKLDPANVDFVLEFTSHMLALEEHGHIKIVHGVGGIHFEPLDDVGREALGRRP